MIEEISKLVFYFELDCPNCHNKMKVSHAVIEEKSGELFCALCGKDLKVPSHESLVSAAKFLNDYVGDSVNAKYINLVLNERFALGDDTPPAH